MTPCVIKAPNPTLTIRHRPPSSVFQFYKGIEEAEAQQGQALSKDTHLDMWDSNQCNPPSERGVLVAFNLPTSTSTGPRKDGNRKPLTAEPEVFPQPNRKQGFLMSGSSYESQEGAALKKRGNSRHTWPLPQTPEGLVRGDTQLCPLSTWSRGQSYTQ